MDKYIGRLFVVNFLSIRAVSIRKLIRSSRTLISVEFVYEMSSQR